MLLIPFMHEANKQFKNIYSVFHMCNFQSIHKYRKIKASCPSHVPKISMYTCTHTPVSEITDEIGVVHFKLLYSPVISKILLWPKIKEQRQKNLNYCFS